MPPSYDLPTRSAQAVLFDCWAMQVRAGHLNRAGLHSVRQQVLFGGDEAGPARDALLVLVGDRIVGDLHVRATDLPGSPLECPDDPRELTDREEW